MSRAFPAIHPAAVGSRQGATANVMQTHPAAMGAILTADEYMATTQPPPQLAQVSAAAAAFAAANSGRRIACVTAGGTIVPLEKNMVRFLDSVSTGARSSACAERFLERGYAVVYLHRKGCLVPFARAFPKPDSTDFFEELAADGSSFRPDAARAKAVRGFRRAQGEGTLLCVPFLSNTEYLWLQQAVALALEAHQRRTLFFFASTLSPFYLPDTAEHKIQRTADGVTLSLRFVPNLLTMFKSWLKDTYCVGFKLETNPALLLENGRKMVRANHHHICVCNLLATRHSEVQLVTGDSHLVISKGGPEDDLEARLADALIEAHSGYVGVPFPPAGASPAVDGARAGVSGRHALVAAAGLSLLAFKLWRRHG